MAIGLHPENMQDTLNNLWGLIDDILFTLKDKSIEVFLFYDYLQASSNFNHWQYFFITLSYDNSYNINFL